MYTCRRERANAKLARFGRWVVAKRRMRQQRLVRRFLVDNATHYRNMAFRAWRSDVRKTVTARAAVALQRYARGRLARKRARRLRRERDEYRRKIGIAFGSREHALKLKIFMALMANADEGRRWKSAVKLQGQWRVRNARIAKRREHERARREGDILGLAMRMRRDRTLKMCVWALRITPRAASRTADAAARAPRVQRGAREAARRTMMRRCSAAPPRSACRSGAAAGTRSARATRPRARSRACTARARRARRWRSSRSRCARSSSSRTRSASAPSG